MAWSLSSIRLMASWQSDSIIIDLVRVGAHVVNVLQGSVDGEIGI